MAVSLDRVYEAVAALQSPDPTLNGPASKWLEEFQKSVYAWTVADQILGEARSFEACLFAAQTIRNKVLHSIRELPPESYGALRDSLLTQLGVIESKLGRSASSIVVQLCAALSDLYIQVVDWHGFVPQMLAQLATQAGAEAPHLLLCLFKTLPEELYSRKLKIGENRRAEVEQELAAQTEAVLTNLSQLCAQDSSGENGVLTKAVHCLASWLLNKQCPTGILANSPLLQSVIGCLGQRNTPAELHDAATDCLVNALQLIDDTPTAEQRPLAQLLQQGVIGTLDAFRAAMREEDSEKLQNYARLYAEHCDAFLTEIARHPREGFGDLRALDMLQLVNDYHEYQLVEMSFNIWYRLSEYLYQCEENDFDDLRAIFSPYVEKHILALCRHCRVEPDSHELLDGRSELADFRGKAQESVKDVTFIVGSVELLRKLMEVLNSSDSWDQMEAILFVISAFVPNIVEAERLVVPTLLEAILKLPMVDTHKQLLKTSAQLLGNLQEWLQANSDYMVRTFNWFCSLFDLSGGIMALTVSECLEQLMERGWQEVQRRELHNSYLSIMEGLLAKVEQSQGKAQEMERAAQHILKASAHLINDLPSAHLCAALERLCAKPIARLSEINKLSNVPPDPQPTLFGTMATTSAGGTSDREENKENSSDAWAGMANDPVLWLDRLSAVWRILKPWQQQHDFQQRIQLVHNGQELNDLAVACPWLTLCTNVLECALGTLQQHQQQQRVVEHSCRTVRFLIRSMGPQSIVFIEPVASQIVLTYGQHPHSCLLYLASILVDEYGQMGHVQQGMLAMLENLANHSLTMLASDPQNGFRDHPDTVDDLYRLAIRFVQRAPCSFFSHPIANQLVQGAIHGLSLNHQDATRSISKFLMETIDVARAKRGINSIPEAEVQKVNQLLTLHGPQFMFSAVSAAIFHLSNSLCKEMAELVFALIQMDKQKAEQWMNHTCAQLPHEGGNSATPEQLLDFRTKVLSSQRPYDIVTAMRELSKFYA